MEHEGKKLLPNFNDATNIPSLQIPVILNPILGIAAQLFFLERSWKREKHQPLLAWNRLKELAFPLFVVSILLFSWGSAIGCAVIIFRGDITSSTLTMLTEVSCSTFLGISTF